MIIDDIVKELHRRRQERLARDRLQQERDIPYKKLSHFNIYMMDIYWRLMMEEVQGAEGEVTNDVMELKNNGGTSIRGNTFYRVFPGNGNLHPRGSESDPHPLYRLVEL